MRLNYTLACILLLILHSHSSSSSSSVFLFVCLYDVNRENSMFFFLFVKLSIMQSSFFSELTKCELILFLNKNFRYVCTCGFLLHPFLGGRGRTNVKIVKNELCNLINGKILPIHRNYFFCAQMFMLVSQLWSPFKTWTKRFKALNRKYVQINGVYRS